MDKYGPITRLLACDERELGVYPYVDIVPTHVHPNFRRWVFPPADGYCTAV